MPEADIAGDMPRRMSPSYAVELGDVTDVTEGVSLAVADAVQNSSQPDTDGTDMGVDMCMPCCHLANDTDLLTRANKAKITI